MMGKWLKVRKRREREKFKKELKRVYIGTWEFGSDVEQLNCVIIWYRRYDYVIWYVRMVPLYWNLSPYLFFLFLVNWF